MAISDGSTGPQTSSGLTPEAVVAVETYLRSRPGNAARRIAKIMAIVGVGTGGILFWVNAQIVSKAKETAASVAKEQLDSLGLAYSKASVAMQAALNGLFEDMRRQSSDLESRLILLHREVDAKLGEWTQEESRIANLIADMAGIKPEEALGKMKAVLAVMNQDQFKESQATLVDAQLRMRTLSDGVSGLEKQYKLLSVDSKLQSLLAYADATARLQQWRIYRLMKMNMAEHDSGLERRVADWIVDLDKAKDKALDEWQKDAFQGLINWARVELKNP